MHFENVMEETVHLQGLGAHLDKFYVLRTRNF